MLELNFKNMDIFGQVAAKRKEIEEATKMNIAKSFQENISTTAEVEEEKVEKSFNDELDEVHRELFGDTLGEIEKAVYADTAQNRKLGRVGQEYHRGKGKKDDKKEVKSNLDFDTKTLLTLYANADNPGSSDFTVGQELNGHKIGEKNDKDEVWMPMYNVNDNHYNGRWTSKEELEHYEKSIMGGVLKEKHYKSLPIGKEFKDDKGNMWKVVKHLPNFYPGYKKGGGRIQLKMKTKDGKSKTLKIGIQSIEAVKNGGRYVYTTGVSSLDKYIKDNF